MQEVGFTVSRAVPQQVHTLNEEAWQEWEEFRRLELRKRIGPIAARKQQKMLTQYPPPIQQYIIDQSIQNSWQGLFPPKGAIPQRQASHAELVAAMQDLD